MPTPRWLRTTAALAVVGLLTAACGDDDGESAAADADADAVEGECEGTELSFTNLRTGESGTASDAFAHTVVDGALYTIYASDYGLTDDDLDSFFPEPPAGSHGVLIQINAFNSGDGSELPPLAVGDEIEWTTTGDGTTKALLVSLSTSEEDLNQASSPHAGGTLTVTAVGDVVCGELDYADADKELAGTFEAPVVQ